MDHLFLFHCDTRGTLTLRHTSTQHKLLAACYSTGSHLPSSSSSHLLHCSHLDHRPDVRCQCRVQVNKETRTSASVPPPDGHGDCYCAASFTASLHLLLLYSKNGQKTQSISSTVFAVFSTAFTIVAPWAIRTTVRKMQQVLTREWEAIHEESTPLQPVQGRLDRQ